MLRRAVLGLGLGLVLELGLRLLGVLPPVPAVGPRKPHLSVDAALDAELAAIAMDPACPLASLAVVGIRAGVIRYEKQLGQRIAGDGVGAGVPADANTLYRIASVSKLVTTLGPMRLLEDGHVALDADVSGVRFDRLMRRLVLDPLGPRGGYNVAELPSQDLANLRLRPARRLRIRRGAAPRHGGAGGRHRHRPGRATGPLRGAGALRGAHPDGAVPTPMTASYALAL